MKIGILTHPLRHNYGGVLQAYALSSYLMKRGHEVYMIYQDNDVTNKYKSKVKCLIGNILCKLVSNDNLPGMVKDSLLQERFDSFISNQFHYYISSTDIKEGRVSLDAIVIGSDQVWRKWGDNWNIRFYFADFAIDKDIKIISYAASIGADKWLFNDEDTKIFSKYVNKYAGVSLRETDSVNIVNEALRINSQMNVDPTLLLDIAEYKQIAINNQKVSIGLVAYILDLDKEKKEVFEELSKLYQSSVYIQSNFDEKLCNSVRPTPNKWLDIMMNAEAIVTDSFHGTAFAINFNRPFVVLSNHFRGQSRLLSILSLFGLESRIVNSPNEALKVMKEKIDWDKVNRMLKEERKRSDNYFAKFGI